MANLANNLMNFKSNPVAYSQVTNTYKNFKQTLTPEKVCPTNIDFRCCVSPDPRLNVDKV